MSIKQTVASWSGELLWKQGLEEAEILDFSNLISIGSWAHKWFRDRPAQAIAFANDDIKQQMKQAELPVLWYNTVDEALSCHTGNAGVSPNEKEMLFG